MGLTAKSYRKPKTNNQQLLRNKLKLELNLRFKTQIWKPGQDLKMKNPEMRRWIPVLIWKVQWINRQLSGIYCHKSITFALAYMTEIMFSLFWRGNQRRFSVLLAHERWKRKKCPWLLTQPCWVTHNFFSNPESISQDFV